MTLLNVVPSKLTSVPETLMAANVADSGSTAATAEWKTERKSSLITAALRTLVGMDSARYADRKISEAMARGELDPQEGVGEPMGALTNDPDWWVRAFMERELMPERFAEMQASVLARTTAAVHADDLAIAREILARVNADIRQWNDRADSPFQLEEHTELWLVTERARRPAR